MPKREFSHELPSELGIDDTRTFEVFGYWARDVHPRSATRVIARCPFCSFEYDQKRYRIKVKCRRCTKRKEPWPDLSHVLDDDETARRFGGRKASETHPASMEKVVYRCTGPCGETSVRYRRRLNDSTLCKRCTASASATSDVKQKRIDTIIERYGSSSNLFGKAEGELRSLVEGWCGNLATSRALPGGKSIDIYLAERQVGIEYCGLYWHHEFSPTPRLIHYHRDKHDACAALGIRLITIFEDEWVLRRKQAEGLLKATLGLHDVKVGARECELMDVPVSEASAFFEAEHLQGASKKAVVATALKHGGKIVGAASLAQHHRLNDDRVLVVNRLCFISGVQVIGGASRLMSRLKDAARRLGAKKLVTWSDNRWSTGDVYERIGFQLESEQKFDYSFVNRSKPLCRLSKQSQRKAASNCPKGKTTLQWAYERGLARIGDCGKKTWVLDL